MNSCFQYSVDGRTEAKIILVFLYWRCDSSFFLHLALTKKFSHIWVSHHVSSEAVLAGNVEVTVRKLMPQQITLI